MGNYPSHADGDYTSPINTYNANQPSRHGNHGGHGGCGGDDGHGHHNHEHDHSDDITPALQHNLYQHIRFDDIVTMNEAEFHSGRDIVKKTWTERLDPTPELASDTDEQILMNVPFTGQVKLHSILLRSSQSNSAPRTLRVFINRNDLDFESADDLAPVQEFELSQTSEVQELPVKRALFGKVQRLTLFFVDNFGSPARQDSDSDEDSDEDSEMEVSRLTYLGFKGEWMQLGRAPAQILYESAPNPNDHAFKGTAFNPGERDVAGRSSKRGS
ncbi:PITH domain-containing protein [Nemania sp. FL0916]|nr:PITH domain-containing protein [Nemania sp. FL0916]